MRKFIVIGSVLLLLSFTAWEMYHFIYFPTLPKSSGEFPDTPVWFFSAREKIISHPVLADKIVFVRTTEAVYAVDIESGKGLWRRNSRGSIQFTPPPIVCGDFLLVPEEKGQVSAYNIHTGELIWQNLPTLDQSSSAKAPSIVITLGFDPGFIPVNSIDCNHATAFIARYNWYLDAVNLKTGDNKWKINLPDRTFVNVAINNQIVYVSLGSQNNLDALDADTGKLIWREEFVSKSGPILLRNDTLYVLVGYDNQDLLAFDLLTQNKMWSYKYSSTTRYRFKFLSEDSGILLLSGDGLAAISAVSGEEIWKKQDLASLGVPAFLNNRLYVRDSWTSLYSIDMSTGELVGKLTVQANRPFNQASDRGPRQHGDLLLVPFGDERLFAYKP